MVAFDVPIRKVPPLPEVVRTPVPEGSESSMPLTMQAVFGVQVKLIVSPSATMTEISASVMPLQVISPHS